MRILLIGNFAPPYEEESLCNFTLLNKLKEEKHDCCVINTSINPSKDKGIINTKGFFDFTFKVFRYSWRKDILHIATKAFTRIALLKVLVSILWSKLFFVKPIVTIYSEMFSVFGQLRSKAGGHQTIYLIFSFAKKIIFGDKDTLDITSRYKIKDNFELVPLFIQASEDLSEGELLTLQKLRNKKKVIVFSNMNYPSLLFDILNKMLTEHVDSDIAIVISFSEKLSAKLQHAIEEAGSNLKDNLVFIDSDNVNLMSAALSRADLILRTMSCEGKQFFTDIALITRIPEHHENYVYFPTSLVMLKEGNVSALCAQIFNNLLMEPIKIPYMPRKKDSYEKIKEIYSSK